MNHIIPLTTAITSTPITTPIPANAPTLIPTCVCSADLEGVDEGLPADPLEEAANRFVAVELELDVESNVEPEEGEVKTPEIDVETGSMPEVEPDVDFVAGLETEIGIEVDAGFAITFDGVGVETDCFTAPIVAAICTPSPSAQHVVLEPPQHQLPSVHCIRATLFVGSLPL